MFDPPPGFNDLVSDAEGCPITGPLRSLKIPAVGTVQARKCRPRAAAALAMGHNKRIPDSEKLSYQSRFLLDHLDAVEYERLLLGTLEGDLPVDALHRVARAVATWGTARPYVAVVTLSLHAGYNWRNIRQKLITSGVANPMKLSSLHALLDVVEDIVVDSVFRAAEREKDDAPPSAGETAVKRFYDEIYVPDPEEYGDEELDDVMPIPTGFDDPAAIEASFDALMHHQG